MPFLALVPGLLLAMAACSDSELSKKQYAEGQQKAQQEGCDCDPFLGDTANSQASQLSARWEEGYINTCVVVLKDC